MKQPKRKSKNRIKKQFNQMTRRDFIKMTGISLASISLPFSGLSCKFAGLPPIDYKGSLIALTKVDPLQSYAGDYTLNPDGTVTPIVESISDLLSTFIQSGETDTSTWNTIIQRINYTYESLDYTLLPILGSNNSKKMRLTMKGRTVLKEVNGCGTKPAKKLLFKPNIVSANVLDFGGNGAAPRNYYGLEGGGVVACTDWSFLAALIRWFHDNLGISYHQMAIGESSSTTQMYRTLFHNLLSPIWGFPYRAEAVFEGRVPHPINGSPIFYGGYPLYYLRKYLADTHDPSHSDDPMQGYLQSIFGPYSPPGQVTDQLPYYNLGNAELNTTDSRGREINVPGGINYDKVTVHKAVIGDPADLENYPGAVLINVPKLKVHSVCILTHAVKNLGIGLWPMQSGNDNDPTTPDYKYAWPSSEQTQSGCTIYPTPTLKGGVYHSPRSKGIMMNCDGGIDPQSLPEESNDGINGSMVDINLAICAEPLVPYILHVSDAIAAANLSHTGSPIGYLNIEGLIMASEDPVALDLFAARYLYKSVSKGTIPGHPFSLWTPGGDVHFDIPNYAIVSSAGGFEWPMEYSNLFSYAEARDFGRQQYKVRGIDRTADTNDFILVSQDGHFGRLVFEEEVDENNWQQKLLQGIGCIFEEVITQPQYSGYGLPVHYWSADAGFWPLQRSYRNLAKATDRLSLLVLGYNSGYEERLRSLDTNNDGILTYGEEGNDVDKHMGYSSIGSMYMASAQIDHANAHFAIKRIKYSVSTWNELGTSMNDSIPMLTAGAMAIQPKTSTTVDLFFGIPYGRNVSGVVYYPSIQFAKYVDELATLTSAYYIAAGYALSNGYTYKLYVPDSLPYFPFVPTPFAPIGPNVESTDDPELICTIKFYNSENNEVEQW